MMDNKTEIVELNAQCDALIKKYLAGESPNCRKCKSEMLRLLAKRHNMRVVDDSLREYTRAISAAKIALGDLFNIDEEE
jgi:ribosomal protein L40E